MTARLQPSALDPSSSAPQFEDDNLSTSSAVVALHDEPPVSSPTTLPRAQVQRSLRELAAERIDDVTHTFFACALLVVAAGGIAVSSVDGPKWMSVMAIALVGVAVVVIGVVRARLRRELVLVGQAQGLAADDAAREADALLARLLRLD